MEKVQARMQEQFRPTGCQLCWGQAMAGCCPCMVKRAPPIRPAPIITVTESTQVIHRPAYFFGGKSREGFFPDLMFGILAGDWT